MAGEAKKSNRTMTDKELEKKLKPYVMGINALHILSFIAIAGMVIDVIVIFIFNEWTTLTAVLVVAFFLLIFVAAYAGAAVKKKYDSILMAEMGPEIEEMISSYFGPQLEKRALDPQKAKGLESCVEQEIRDTRICKDFNRSYMDSYRKGSIGGQIFEGFNAKLTMETEEVEVDSRGDDGAPDTMTVERTVFDGFWIMAQMKQEVEYPLIVHDIGDKDDNTDAYWNYRVDDKNFSEKFCVHSQNIDTASDILTSKLMEVMMKIKDYTKEKCRFCLKGNKMYIAVEGKGRFLCMSGDSTEHIEDLKKNLKDSLQYTAGIIEILLENKDIFGPEELQ